MATISNMDLCDQRDSGFGWSTQCNKRNKIIGLVLLAITLVGVLAVSALIGYYLGRQHSDERQPPTSVSTTVAKTTTATKNPITLTPTQETIARFFDLTPSHYDILLEPDIYSGDDVLNGTVKMFLRANKCLDVIRFNIQTIAITDYKVMVNGEAEEITNAKTSDHEDEGQIFAIRIKRKICANDCQIEVAISYTGTLNQPGIRGFYSSLVNEKDNSSRIASTLFAPKNARRAFPCLDDPLLKATFTISIIHRKDYQAISNTPIEKRTTERPGLVRTRFQKTPHKMSTYLVAMAVVKNYTAKNYILNQTLGQIKLRTLAPKQFQGELFLASFFTKPILAFFNKYTNFFFSFPKLDQIVLPRAVSMANWGLITYEYPAIIYSEDRVSTEDQHHVLSAIAHELAHQWFGNVVTMDWWSELWLNEGMASFFQMLAMDTQYNKGSNFLSDHRSALLADEDWDTHSIRSPVKTNEAQFDTITSLKGASVLRMLYQYIGKKVFQQGIRNYILENQYANADTDALWDAMDKAKPSGLPASVKEIMTNWTDLPGFPLITVNLTRKGNGYSIGFCQQRYLRIGADGGVQNDTGDMWMIPITYVVENGQSAHKYMLTGEYRTTVCTGCTASSWIKVNHNAGGFYRVNYDGERWDALARQLSTDYSKIPRADRFTLIDDAFSLAINSKLPYEKALNLVKYISNETSVEPVMAVIPHLSYISEMLWNEVFANERNRYELWKEFIINSFRPIAKYLGWRDRNYPYSYRDSQHLRSILFPFLCWHRDQVCMSKSKTHFKRMKKQENVRYNNPGWLSPNLLPVVLAYGQEGKEDSEFIWKTFKGTAHPHTKKYFAHAIGFAKDPRLLRHYLDRLLSMSSARYKAVDTALDSFTRNPLIHTIVTNWMYDFVINHNITKTSPWYKPMHGLMNKLASRLNHPNDIRVMKQAIQRVPFSCCTGIITRNINWKKLHTEEIAKWLEKQGYKQE